MLPRTRRLTRTAHRAVRLSRLEERNKVASIRFTRTPPGAPSRISVVVSKSVAASAVARNRIRRRVYEAVRTSPEGATGFTAVIYMGRTAATVRNLVAPVRELLAKAALRCATAHT